MRKILRGPNGLRIELDSDEIFPNDLGQGTPVMVYFKKHSATYDCALDTGELDCGDYYLTDEQLWWLEGKCEEVNYFLDPYLKVTK